LKRPLFFFPFIPILLAITLHAQPKLVVAGGRTLALGKVYEGRTIRHEFMLRNPGTDTLRIDSVRTSCGCTIARLPSQRIAPDRQLTLSVSFDTKDITGAFTRQIFINTNDPSEGRAVISCGMDIRPVIRVEPRYISFGRLRTGDEERKTVRLRNALSVPVRILKYTASDPQLSLRLSTRLLAPGETALLEVALRAARPGRLLGQLELRTDTSLKPVLKISYTGRIRKIAG